MSNDMSEDLRPYIFIDTCSLLDSCWNPRKDNDGQESFVYSREKAETFWGKEFRSLEAMGDVIIPARNYEELLKHSQNKKKPDLAKRAQEIIDRITRLHQSKRIQVVGDPNDPFADAILLSVALKFRTQNNMAFVTQDRKLAKDLDSIRHFESVRPRKGYDIKIRRINKDGTLGKHKWLGDSEKTDTANKVNESKEKNWWDQ